MLTEKHVRGSGCGQGDRNLARKAIVNVGGLEQKVGEAVKQVPVVEDGDGGGGMHGRSEQ